MIYSEGFKARMVRRMAGAERISATALSSDVGVTQPTLSRWLREARSVGAMKEDQDEGAGKTKRRRKWTPEEKLRVVNETSQLTEDELGAYLRREGLHEARLQEWRTAITAALKAGNGRSGKASPDAKRIRALEKDLRRKEKALAEVVALLALKKKVQEIWGDEDDDTDTRSGT